MRQQLRSVGFLLVVLQCQLRYAFLKNCWRESCASELLPGSTDRHRYVAFLYMSVSESG